MMGTFEIDAQHLAVFAAGERDGIARRADTSAALH
jgi:hypothetical protein